MDLLLHSKFDGSICHIKNLKVPEHENEVAHRHDLLEKVWGFDITPTTRTVDNYILDLRKKLEPDPTALPVKLFQAQYLSSPPGQGEST